MSMSVPVPIQLAEESGRITQTFIFAYTEDVEAGGLISYRQNVADFYKRADYVNKILKGAKPGDLPVEQPTVIHFSVNNKTAKSIGLVIPKDLLVSTNEVIE
jgi:putative tryptophan/tyrosine transport system substrate-binding protein